MLNRCLPQPAAESSSLPSGQSRSPSQSQRFGTQAYDPGQLNSPGAHVTEPERKTRPHAPFSQAKEYNGSNAPKRRMSTRDTELKQMYFVWLRWYLLLSVNIHQQSEALVLPCHGNIRLWF